MSCLNPLGLILCLVFILMVITFENKFPNYLDEFQAIILILALLKVQMSF